SRGQCRPRHRVACALEHLLHSCICQLLLWQHRCKHLHTNTEVLLMLFPNIVHDLFIKICEHAVQVLQPEPVARELTPQSCAPCTRQTMDVGIIVFYQFWSRKLPSWDALADLQQARHL